jgi:molybdate transport system substrate-binding protein
MRGLLLIAALVFSAAAFAQGAGQGDAILVLSGGAARGFVEPLAKSFQHPVKLEYQAMGQLVKTMATSEGARYDMVIVTPEVLDKLNLKDGKPLARVGIGVAVRENAPLPDISTPQALAKTLLAAKSVVYINPQTGTSGKHVVEMFRKLNILEQMQAKTTLVDSGYAVAPVGRGEVELGIHQISEILPVKGVRLVGPLPAELQQYTVYVGAAVRGTPRAGQVAQFIRHLTSDEARGRLAAAGYSPAQ